MMSTPLSSKSLLQPYLDQSRSANSFFNPEAASANAYARTSYDPAANAYAHTSYETVTNAYADTSYPAIADPYAGNSHIPAINAGASAPDATEHHPNLNLPRLSNMAQNAVIPALPSLVNTDFDFLTSTDFGTNVNSGMGMSYADELGSEIGVDDIDNLMEEHEEQARILTKKLRKANNLLHY